VAVEAGPVHHTITIILPTTTPHHTMNLKSLPLKNPGTADQKLKKCLLLMQSNKISSTQSNPAAPTIPLLSSLPQARKLLKNKLPTAIPPLRKTLHFSPTRPTALGYLSPKPSPLPSHPPFSSLKMPRHSTLSQHYFMRYAIFTM